MTFAGIAAALKGMFRLRPNNASYNEMMKNLDELRTVTASSRHVSDFEETMRRITQEVGR